jgi:ATP synthase protein I
MRKFIPDREGERMKSQKGDKETKRPYQALAMASAIGADLAGTTLGGLYLGKYLDRLLGTSPWLLLIGILTGLACGIYGIRLIAQRFTD